MSAIRTRSSGQRKLASRSPKDLIGPSIGLAVSGRPGEFRLNSAQIGAIEALFNTHPAIFAAVSILKGQLLSGGIVLRRGGKDVELKAAFSQHLDEVWLPFASAVIDSFLKFGYVVVAYEEDLESLAAQSKKRRKDGLAGQQQNLIPLVPPIDTYDVAFVMGGRCGYQRQYLCYAMSPSQATKVDDEVRIVVRSHPDSAGNVNSPMSTIFDLGSFVAALVELALTAETSNCRPKLWTQPRAVQKSNGLDTSALFFDSESRDLAAGRDTEESALQAQNLALQQQLMKSINKYQHMGVSGADVNTRSFSGGLTAPTSHVPPEVSPSLFCLPKGFVCRHEQLATLN